MQPVPNRCPLCGGELTVTRIYCRSCDTAYEGRFSSSLFSNLTQDQLNFMVTFVRCEGKISRVGEEIGLSYPTIRNRLHEVIRALGYEPGGDDEPPGLTDEERQRILEDLDSGAISAAEAMRLLREVEA
ncbi:MAG: hypothetical protein B6D39_10325 [Anaerolineae bacterium UTCFX2]|jgi:hypothetical protein|nr:DUF2089 domain-containing protein [Anaerolineae bacterium]OQY89103.1 MAG: hypothetical protein B6D39_10325 [Anaerolineae bacterium UTCFX2]